MRGLILLGLLAGVHGLGNTFPYQNIKQAVWTETAQKTGEWDDNTCKTGTKQSPIDIDTKAAKVSKTDPGAIMAYGHELDAPMQWRVNGKSSVDLYFSALEVYHVAMGDGLTANPIIMGGPLDQKYKFSHIEFHWGKNDATMGAEHTFDGKRAAMEMYLVYHKTEWSLAKSIKMQAFARKVDYDRAVHGSVEAPLDPAGIAVIAFQIDEGAENAELLPLTLEIVAAGNKAKAGMAARTTASGGASFVPADAANMNISKLIMQDEGSLADYYYYDGSLTNPADDHTANTNADKAHACAEIVRWILPTQRLTMSKKQMDAFNSETNFKLKDTPLRNSRVIQTGTKISDVTVNRRMPIKTTDDAVWRNLAGTLLSVGTFGLVHNLLTQDETAKALTENPVVEILQDIEQRFVRPAAPQERQAFNHHHHPQDIQY